MVEVFIKLWYLNEKERKKIKFLLAMYVNLFQGLYLIWEVKRIIDGKRNTQLIGRTLNKMYKAPTEENFKFIASFWRVEVTKVPRPIRGSAFLVPHYVTARNINRPELSKRLFDFKLTHSNKVMTVAQFNITPEQSFKSRTYEETLTILAIREIIAHAKAASVTRLFFHSNHKFILESMFTVGFKNYVVTDVGNDITSVCAQKTI